MPPAILAAFLAAAASSSNPGGGQFRPMPGWPMPGAGFQIPGFPGLPPPPPLFKTGEKTFKIGTYSVTRFGEISPLRPNFKPSLAIT